MVSVLNQRSAGLLVHPTSLPGPHAAGDIGLSSRQFVDFLHESGLSWWQMLPIHPTGACGSPYDSPSAFAGGEHLISVDDLVDAGLLDDDELEDITQVEHGRTAILDKAQTGREELLRRAFRRFEESPGGQLHLGMDEFIAQNREWVIDYATFVALRQVLPGSSWVDWPEELRTRDPQALEAAREEHKAEIRYRVFAQFVFHRQWARLRRYAAERGVQLMGDMPMFVSHDSVDVWRIRTVLPQR